MKELFKQRLNHLAQLNHRELIVFSGEQDWCLHSVNEWLPYLLEEQGLWLGEGVPEAMPVIHAAKASQWLGRERQFVVFNGWSGFDVDAFGAISGVVKGGGVMFLLVPELAQWSQLEDPEHCRITVYPETKNRVTGRYIQRLAKLLTESEHCSLIQQHKEPAWSALPNLNVESEASDDFGYCQTPEQAQAVEAIKKVATGHRRRPLVLTADRGRGKSAALGIAAAQLLTHGLKRIVVTGPSLASTEQVFQHAGKCLENTCLSRGTFSGGRVQWQDKSIQFMAPDEIVVNPVDCDLMLVDEAAALPVPLLETLLRQQSRIVFSSTIHGYEGTGRGFAIRFRKKVDSIAPKWRALSIRQAIRWADHDPLEQLVFSSLLLDASPAEDHQVEGATAEQCEWVCFDRDQLVQNESMVAQVFGLLVLAHYRTRPFDLRHFLDGPNIEVYGLLYKGRLVGTVLAAREGAIDASMQEPIWLGQRRVRGHLIPQSLSNHAGIPEAIRQKGLRVLRIAVHPAIHRKGLGAEMLNCLAQSARDKGFDYLGTSFGATSGLLNFWQNSGYQPVRTGLQREAASGCYSLMMLQSLSEAGNELLVEARSRFFDNFLLQLPESLKVMEAELVRQLFRGASDFSSADLSERDWQDIASFSRGQRLFESCLPAVRKLLLKGLVCAGSEFDSCEQALRVLVIKVLQQQSWSNLAQYEGLAGKKQVLVHLRSCVGQLETALKSRG